MTSKFLSEMLAALPAFESAFPASSAKGLIETLAPQPHKFTQAAAATGFFPVHVASKRERVKRFTGKVDICGSSSTTSLMPQIVRKGTSSAAAEDLLSATMDFVNTDADGKQLTKVAGVGGLAGGFDKTSVNLNLEIGDALYVHESSAAGSATGVFAEFEVEPVYDV